MPSVLASLQRRLAITILVFAALFATCASVHAMPCDANDGRSVVQHVLDAVEGGDADDASLPSLEDNASSLDDTFDVPPQHVVSVPRSTPSRPPGHEPESAAHRLHPDLRPPIA